ncbi:MAG TPA: ABC transporter permease, partial [Thermoplasmata archaeon]|nr:ABC transporter permease [Thermoplasmata archaeon]
MNPKRIAADFSVFAKGYLRNPIALFFSLIFPIILVGIFGVIFSSSTLNPVTLYVENQDHDSNASVAFLAALNQTHAVKINVVNTSGENLSVWLSDPTHTGGSVSAGLVIPVGFAAALQNHTPLALPLYLNPTDPSSSALVQGAVQGVANGVNLRQYGGTPILTPQVGNVGTRVLSSIDYLVPGLIGFAVLTSPMFSLV